MTLKQYIESKIRMLTRDFLIELTEEEIDYMHSLTSEVAVDTFAHNIFMTRL